MKKVGVVIGRFQVAQLHAGHKHLISYAETLSDELLILIGTTEAMPSTRNPLTFEVRCSMIKQSFPTAKIAALPDHPSDKEWSTTIDQIIETMFGNHKATLFGSRDSFIPYYCGKFPTQEVPEIKAPSGTESRRKIQINDTTNEDFLSGMIYAQKVRFPISYQTVDVAVIRKTDNKVLMGRKKKDGEKYRFIGGFVDPTDASLEDAALRETSEEAGPIKCGELTYLGSFRVTDYRYKNELDKIMTSLFATEIISGKEKAGDDIDELAWISLHKCANVAIDAHIPLANRLINFQQQK